MIVPYKVRGGCRNVNVYFLMYAMHLGYLMCTNDYRWNTIIVLLLLREFTVYIHVANYNCSFYAKPLI